MNFSQYLVNSLIAFSYLVLIGLGFSLYYSTTRFFNFAHAAIFTLGAYFTYLFKIQMGFPFVLAIFLAIFLSSILGCLLDLTIYRPLRKKRASSMILLLTSLGIYIILQNLISLLFGDDTRSIQIWEVKEGINIFGARITSIQIFMICIGIILSIMITMFMLLSKTGKAMRAIASDPELSEFVGIDKNKIFIRTFAIGSTLAAIAGILVALDVDMTPTMGMRTLMMGVVAVIVGGVGSIPGVALGALLLGFTQQLGIWTIGSQWQDAIVFIILIIFLLFKPEGFLGKKVKMAKL
jgi:branched-chain amino acid transport system permease protein